MTKFQTISRGSRLQEILKTSNSVIDLKQLYCIFFFHLKFEELKVVIIWSLQSTDINFNFKLSDGIEIKAFDCLTRKYY